MTTPSDDQTKPTVPPPADMPTVVSNFGAHAAKAAKADNADLPTQMANLSGNPDQATQVTNLARPEQATQVTNLASAPGPGVTKITQLPGGGDTQDNLRTQPADQRQRPSQHGTQVTHLNVETGAKGPGDPGTHNNQQWGDFLIGSLLGKGGMGSVYRGKQVSLDRMVAIKVLPSHLSQNESFRARFAVEAKAVAQINSGHVIQVYAAGQHEGHHYFAMEYIEGEDLSVKLRKGWKPSHRESLDLVRQAARGLAAAGELGIIHRDIKPANMMLTKKGVLKLMDFGLAKLAASGETGLTMAGTIMGTVSYFSPEQGRGEVCDQRTDIYALGIVFYELLTGKLPFTGQDATSIIYQHIHQSPRAPKEIDPNIPENYQGVVLKCMQKRTEDRYQTAAEMLADLDALAEGRMPSSAFFDPAALRSGADVVRNKPFAAERSRAPLFIGLAVAGVVVVGGGIWFATRSAPKPPDTPVVLGRDPLPGGGTTNPGDPVVPITLPTGPGKDVLMKQARGLLDGKAYATARRQVQNELRSAPRDAEWLALMADIDRTEGEDLLQQAETAFTAGETDKAGAAAATAQGLIPDSAELKLLMERLSAREGASKQRNRLLDEARTSLKEGQAKKAEDILAKLAEQLPADEEVAKELRVARKQREDQDARTQALAEQLANGEQAVARKDYDGAQIAFTAALQLDPGSEKASKGLALVNQVKQQVAAIRERFSAALKNRDLATAERELAALRTLVPNSATQVLAETELNNSKLLEEDARKRQGELEAKMSAQAKAVLQVIEDPKSDIAEMEKALKTFLAGAGQDRPERADLEKRIEDKRQLKIVQAGLDTLDKAMLAKDPAAVRGVVKDDGFASALTELQRYDGLVFESRVDDFTRTGAQAVAKVSLRHALTVFPERVLRYTYQLRQDGAGWVIIGATLNP